MPIIDLRSDTVTKPTTEMRRAMAAAEVGDDVFGDDPTVNLLQERVATLFGKEASLFVPSGTMGNQVCLAAHTEPGDEILFESHAHIFDYEVAAAAVLSGIMTHPIVGTRGVFTADDVRSRIRPVDVHCARTRVVAVENTHNVAGGTVYPIDEIEGIATVCREHDLRFHLDGARIWNAHVASGIQFAEYGRHFDSISVCFSKGLGCPVGSMAIGSAAVIERAHRARKRFGGGMRQVGILAAAVLYALDHHVERMATDHDHARHLATELSVLPGVDIDLEATQTNIVYLDVAATGKTGAEVEDELRRRDVLAIALGPTRLRCVTHLQVDRAGCEQAVAAFKEILS